ncbi:CPBP family intramembrane glutamic endopeptidase [Croceiramulus getboli]
MKDRTIFPKNIIQTLIYALFCIFISVLLIISLGLIIPRITLVIFLSEILGYTIIIVVSMFIFRYKIGIWFGNTNLFKRLVFPVIIMTLGLYFTQAIPTYYFLAPTERYNDLINFSFTYFGMGSLLLTAPFFEELIYRDFIFKRLMKSKSFIYSASITSFVFAASHLNIYTFLNLFIYAFLLCFLYSRTKSILLCIMSHISYGFARILLSSFYDYLDVYTVSSIFAIYGNNTAVIYFMVAFITILLIILSKYTLKASNSDLLPKE